MSTTTREIIDRTIVVYTNIDEIYFRIRYRRNQRRGLYNRKGKNCSISKVRQEHRLIRSPQNPNEILSKHAKDKSCCIIVNGIDIISYVVPKREEKSTNQNASTSFLHSSYSIKDVFEEVSSRALKHGIKIRGNQNKRIRVWR